MMNPLIIPVFLPNLGCRERCLFCNQKTNAIGVPSPSSVQSFIETSLLQVTSHQKNREKQVAYYGGSFTAIPQEEQVRYLKTVRPFLKSGMINSVRISTRPDTLDEKIFSLLKEYGVKTVELGIQSMIDEVLFLAQRGHSVEDSISAISRLKKLGFEVGCHLMIGLPGDTLDRFQQTLDQIIDLKPNFVRIHPTLVLKGSPLENLWATGDYFPLSLHEAIEWLKKGVIKLELASIPVARIGIQPTRDLENNLLAGPYHSSLHQLVDSTIFLDMARHLLQISPNESRTSFFCHPREVSNLRGQRNENILTLKEHFKLSEIFIHERKDLSKGCLVMQTQKGELSIHRKSLGF